MHYMIKINKMSELNIIKKKEYMDIIKKIYINFYLKLLRNHLFLSYAKCKTRKTFI